MPYSRNSVIGRIHALALILISALPVCCLADESPPSYDDLESPAHQYSNTTPRDRVTRLKNLLEKEGAGPALDRSSEKAFLRSLLKELGIPESSQLLLFSTTSLQLRLINPGNPRSIYFTEDVYVGYIPGGKIEIAAVDPDLGCIFYIFDIPRTKDPVRLERSDRCMNCHASEETGHVPGLVIKSVIPGRSGGSINAFRIGQTGHQIPLEQRFGGWHVTHDNGFTNHLGNFIGRMTEGVLQRIPNPVGERFNTDTYLTPGSELLAHLVFEHQAGFINRTTEAAYRLRTLKHNFPSQSAKAVETPEIQNQILELTKYILFSNEAPLPATGLPVNSAFALEFQSQQRRDSKGASLRELDLRTRLFRYRCSFMIHGIAFQGLHPDLKKGVYDLLRSALSPDNNLEIARHIPAPEKSVIRNVLKSTIQELGPGW